MARFRCGASLAPNQEEFNAGRVLRTVRLHRNGRLIVTVATDNVIQLWNWSGRLLATLPGESVAMSPDGGLLAVLLPSGNTPRVWPISVAAYLRRLETLQLPCLTPTQLREGLLLDEAEAQRQERRCTPTGQTGKKP